MYGFEMDYGYEPATEGIRSFFESVLDMCRKAGQMIKEFIDKVAYALKKMVNDPDTVKKESGKASAEIRKIGKDIEQLLKNACGDIDILVAAWTNFAKYKNMNAKQMRAADKRADAGKTHIIERQSGTTRSGNPKYEYAQVDFSKTDGMSADLDTKAMEKDGTLKAEWQAAEAKLGRSFAESERTATEISARLKGLSQYGRLTYAATKGGYDSLREIFDANGKFGAQWKKVQSAAEWATGPIKTSLNKIVSMYKVGISATQAFGRRLERGNVAKNNGEAYSAKERKGIMAEGKAINRVYDNYTSSRDITTSKKDVNRQNWATDFGDVDMNRTDTRAFGGATNKGMAAAKKRLSKDQLREYNAIKTPAGKLAYLQRTVGVTQESASYALDRLYQAAYEDAYNDIQEQQYYQDVYDSVPGAFEFVEEDADYDAYEDKMIYDYDPLSEDVDVEEDVYGF